MPRCRTTLIALTALVAAFLPALAAAPASAATAPNTLAAPANLAPGSTVSSPDGNFRLAMQTDGNLVLYSRANRALWNTHTSGNGGAWLAVQADGNLVVYSAGSRPLWNSATRGRGGTNLVMQDDGNLVFYTTAGKAVWWTGTRTPAGTDDNPYLVGPASGTTVSSISPSTLVLAGGALYSPNGNFRLVMQADGNLVLYTIQNNALWNSRTVGTGASFALLANGDPVVFSPSRQVVWDAGAANSGGVSLRLQDDGNLVLYTATGQAVWKTGTVVPAGTNNNPVPSATLRAPATLRNDAALISPNGAFRAVMQSDGNFVVYSGSTALWSTRTAGNSGAYLVMQSDNNLVLYSAANRAIWYTSTRGTGANQLLLGNDGVLRLYDPPGNLRWQNLIDGTFVAPGSNITITGLGNGHGHGMSQYGALGAAQAGLTAAQIVAFYYPGTTLTTLPAPLPTLRVLLGNTGSTTCILAKAGLTATSGSSAAALPSTGLIRLQQAGTGIAVQTASSTNCSSGTWTTLKSWGAQVDVSSTQGYVRLVRPDGSSTDYRGTLGAVISGGQLLTINRVDLDSYAAGVVPREMPASWPDAAVQAQAIAARSYALNQRNTAGSAPYDICDSDWCQVYGGMAKYATYNATTNPLWTEDMPPVTATAGQVLTFGSSGAIFAQFSASNGGYTVAGGMPYLVAKADPYDHYPQWSATMSAASLAANLGLQAISLIQVTQRDGNGMWGGRVLYANVSGTSTSGAAVTIQVTGYQLQSAFGVGSTLFHF